MSTRSTDPAAPTPDADHPARPDGDAVGDDARVVSVAVAHRSRMVTEGLTALLRDDPHLSVIATTTEPPRFAATDVVPDVLVLDPSLTDETVTVADLAARHRDMAIVLLADAADAEHNIRLLADGAIGLVDETVGADAVAHAVQAAVHGLGVAPAMYIALAARRLADAFEDRFAALDEDELALWRDVADGLDNATIAERHFVSERTARRHVDALLECLGVDNRVQAAELAGRVFLRDRHLTGHDGPASPTDD